MTVLPVRTRRRLMRHPYGWVASGFGAGFSPWAPGTVGTAVALVPWWYWGHALQFWQYAVVLLAAFLVGTVAAGWVIRDVGVDDPSLVVWDEFVGVWLALWTLPREWPWLLAGFAVFRLFDIWKPWPVRWADRSLHGGFGAMADDALAGLLAFVVLQVAHATWA